ncbi:metallophosphoesterase family protein [Hyalangium versicolor]|uniref:metallophosphoesterase family protein n=1 Tax=Hyalangium versicolor TaxID=2861190 RepID=UPI001CCAB5D6|nr:metallophosphoesterase [Hyalangium versicolor]
MATLRILHLSDFHQGQGGQQILWPHVRAEFEKDLEKLHVQTGPWDLVLFTGDLTQRGTEAEFQALDQTLKKLWEKFATLGSNPELLFVPGNHDLQRPKSTSSVVKALTLWKEDEEIRNAFWSEPKGEYRKAVARAFEPFTKWAQTRYALGTLAPKQGLLPGDFSATVTRNGLSVGVVGLNSSFLQLSGRNFDGELHVDVRQFNAVCDNDPVGWLARHPVSLLLTHHPVSWLSPAPKAEFREMIDRPGNFLAHLHGHMHESTAVFSSEGAARPRRRLCGASLFGLEEWVDAQGKHVQRIHGYSAIQIDVDGTQGRLTIWPRSLELNVNSGHRRMVPDQRQYDLGDDGSFSVAFEVAAP